MLILRYLEEVTTLAAFTPARVLARVAAMNTKLWLVGGWQLEGQARD